MEDNRSTTAWGDAIEGARAPPPGTHDSARQDAAPVFNHEPTYSRHRVYRIRDRNYPECL